MLDKGDQSFVAFVLLIALPVLSFVLWVIAVEGGTP